MRMIVAAAFLSVLALSSAASAADPQIAAKPEAETASSEALTTSDARKIARDYLKDQNLRSVVVNKVRQRDGKFHVDLTSVEGIPVRTLVIDAKTGKVEG